MVGLRPGSKPAPALFENASPLAGPKDRTEPGTCHRAFGNAARPVLRGPADRARELDARPEAARDSVLRHPYGRTNARLSGGPLGVRAGDQDGEPASVCSRDRALMNHAAGRTKARG